MQLEDAALHGPLLINDVIFAETSIRFESIEAFDAALADAGITFVPIPRPALFLAGKASLKYRTLGGARSGVLPDLLLALMLRLKTCHAADSRYAALPKLLSDGYLDCAGNRRELPPRLHVVRNGVVYFSDDRQRSELIHVAERQIRLLSRIRSSQ